MRKNKGYHTDSKSRDRIFSRTMEQKGWQKHAVWSKGTVLEKKFQLIPVTSAWETTILSLIPHYFTVQFMSGLWQINKLSLVIVTNKSIHILIKVYILNQKSPYLIFSTFRPQRLVPVNMKKPWIILELFHVIFVCCCSSNYKNNMEDSSQYLHMAVLNNNVSQ